MSRRNIVGFETGDFAEAFSTSGTAAVQSSVVRSGGYAAQVNPTTTGTGWIQLRAHGANGTSATLNAATLYMRLCFRYATRPAANDEELVAIRNSFSVIKLALRLNSSGQLVAYNTLNALLATGTKVLAANQWYCIEVKCATGSSAAWEVRVDGTVELSGTGNLSTSNAHHVLLGKANNRNGQTVDFFYDDVALDDAAYPGPACILRLDPDGAGTYTAWTGTVADADEVPHDGDTSYLASNVNNDVESVTLEAARAAGIYGPHIRCVKSVAVVRETSAGGSVQLLTKSGATEDYTAAAEPASSYAVFAKHYETDPAGGAWAHAGLDALEVGVKCAAFVALRCTLLCAMVEFLPAVPRNAYGWQFREVASAAAGAGGG